MDKQIIVFNKQEPKKHSVCFKTDQADAAVTSIYIMRTSLGRPVPKTIKVTIEEVELLGRM